MDRNVFIGTLVSVVALGTICGLVLISIRKINRIANKRLKSVRDIVRGLNHDR